MNRFVSQFFGLVRLLAVLSCAAALANAQSNTQPGTSSGVVVSAATTVASTHFRIGEKLTYNISFGKILNAAYAEMSVVSRGTLSGRDAVELHSKVKTIELVNAAFFQWDETRTVYVSPDTGLPLLVTKRMNNGLAPVETSVSYLKTDTSSFDLLSLIYKAREAAGVGSFPLVEGDKAYTVVFQAMKPERVSTEAGEFDTVTSVIQSDYLAANGIKEIKVNFSSDDNHYPVLFRVKTAKGEFRVSLAAIQQPKAVAIVVPTPVRTPTPGPPVKPKPSPTPYVDNQPLAAELGFDLGETLDYAVTSGGTPVATITLEAKDRRLWQNEDTLVLMATVTKVEPGTRSFVIGDFMRAYVDPETLTPRLLESRFSGEFSWLNQTVTFYPQKGAYSVNGGAPAETPVGTHTLLSLIYAMRSFNLKPSKDPNNPVNDTRVAVFWETQPYVFTLRPANSEVIGINGEKIAAQPVKATTGNPDIDRASPRVWLSPTDRVPLRFTFGAYQADLINVSKRSY
jgi:Protein of unknown function (DUF3108)